MIPSDPQASLRGSFREWLLPEVFRDLVRSLNRTQDGQEWLTGRQLDDLRDQLLRHPSRTLLEANEEVQKLLFKAQVDVNEILLAGHFKVHHHRVTYLKFKVHHFGRGFFSSFSGWWQAVDWWWREACFSVAG